AGIPIGQRTELSPGDIDGVDRLYGFIPTTTTIATIPSGLAIVVDGNELVSPQSFNWAAGTQHTIAVAPVQGTDPRHTFIRWTDGGGVGHIVTASPDRTVIAAEFSRAHPFQIVALGSGTATATPAGADGYPEGLPLRVRAVPDAGNNFLGWGGLGLF